VFQPLLKWTARSVTLADPRILWRFFQKWIIYSLTAPNFTPSQIVAGMAMDQLTTEVKAAYDESFPSFIYKAAVRAFPSMIAAIEDQNLPAWERSNRLFL
jgi:hypothetical protein